MTSEADHSGREAHARNSKRAKRGEGSFDSRIVASVGYLPMLFFLPLLAGRQDSYARLHGQQSLLLLLTFVVLWVSIWLVSLILGRVLGEVVLLGFIFRALSWFLSSVVGALLSLGYLIAMVLGIVRAATGSYWKIPLVGTYAERYRST